MSFKRVNGRIDINSCMNDGTIIIDEEEQRGARTNFGLTIMVLCIKIFIN